MAPILHHYNNTPTNETDLRKTEFVLRQKILNGIIQEVDEYFMKLELDKSQKNELASYWFDLQSRIVKNLELLEQAKSP